ncbi:acyltransferase family protein [Vibrio agarivorans]|uniref:Acyltransferase family protein n=1 Tax=Vibrio agarivorans TaxID=153622 RepID=A0ABT7Y3D7_9VIBR|nr:acyltransferase family protein [Vibrio agarivorans]MDN2482535.1 acyltransferase family protein [Vibrio agarivorans]
MQGKPINYRPDVDGLRAVAVLVVVLFHAGFEQLSGGYIGVDVFFVISGYVIMLSLLHMLDNGTFSITEFYYRRAKRIMPALFFTLLLTTVVAHALFLPELYHQYLQSLIASLTFVSNLFFWKTTNYFGSAAELKPLLHTWSLSLEEQYYIFAPIYVAAVYRWLNKNWYLALYPPLIASFALSWFLMDKAASANYFMLPTRGWEILLGAVLAAAPPFKLRTTFVANLLGVIGLVAIVSAAVLYNKDTAFPGLSALLPCLGAAAIIMSGSFSNSEPSWVQRGLALKPVVYVGLLSYSLYLVHWPITVFFKYYRLAPLSVWDSLMVIALSFAFAMASYYWVEQPIRRRKALSRKQVFSISGAGIASFVTFAITVQVVSVERQPTELLATSQPTSDPCFLMNAKHYPGWDSKVCTLVDSPKGERVLMWGDSFLNHYTKGFESLAKQQQLTLIKYASAGCPPIMTFESFALPYCDEFNRNALELIEALDIDVVFLSAKWSDHQQAGLDRLTSTLEKLDNLGVRYLVFGQSPQFITDVSIIDDQKGQGKASNAWPTTIKEAINQELELLITSGDFINPMPSLCEAGVCEYKLNGEMLFSDYGHLSQQGSLVVVNTLTNDIERWLKQ